MSAGHDQETLAHWAIRYESVRLRLTQVWGMHAANQNAAMQLEHWQRRQQYLFEQAQRQDLNARS